MAGSEAAGDPIPKCFDTIEQAGAFWDSHDLADYLDDVEDVEFEVDVRFRQHLVALEPGLYEKLAAESRRQGLHAETLVNLWLAERLHQTHS